MRIPRIYTAENLELNQSVYLAPSASTHIKEVLRLKKNHTVVLFNGDGYDYTGEIIRSEKKQIEIQLNSKQAVTNESSLNLHLLQPVCRSEKMDWCIQKATELGVTEITPVICTRSNIKFADHKIEKKLTHWQAVIHSACEQSGRATLPIINTPKAFSNAIAQHNNVDTLRIAAIPNATSDMQSINLQKNISCVCAIGPEGGFSDDELNLLGNENFQAISLGPRILRLETAVISLVTLAQSRWGDLN